MGSKLHKYCGSGSLGLIDELDQRIMYLNRTKTIFELLQVIGGYIKGTEIFWDHMAKKHNLKWY